jgi:uncharacterized phage-associated protein
MISAKNISDFFLVKAIETQSFISNLKLQKLVYYAQAWHLGIAEKEIFQEDFQAWVHGPVLPSLYHDYKHFRWAPIILEKKPELSITADLSQFLEDICTEYFACEAYDLERMTHAEKPWQLARQGLKPDEPSSNIIEKDWMKEFYGSRAQEA